MFRCKGFSAPPPSYAPPLPPGGEFWYGIRKWKGGEEKAGGGMETEREMKRKRDIEGGKGRGGEKEREREGLRKSERKR